MCIRYENDQNSIKAGINHTLFTQDYQTDFLTLRKSGAIFKLKVETSVILWKMYTLKHIYVSYIRGGTCRPNATTRWRSMFHGVNKFQAEKVVLQATKASSVKGGH